MKFDSDFINYVSFSSSSVLVASFSAITVVADVTQSLNATARSVPTPATVEDGRAVPYK